MALWGPMKPPVDALSSPGGENCSGAPGKATSVAGGGGGELMANDGIMGRFMG